MSDALLSGSGEVVVTTEFQLLDPNVIYGASSFYYDFYLKGESVDADGAWQIDDGGFVDMDGVVGVLGDGDVELVKRIEVDATSAGLVRIARNAGTLSYWYALNGTGNGRPTVLAVEGVSSAVVEFYVQKGRVYSITSDGAHAWEYWDGSGWTAFSEGSTNGFSFDAPPSGRIQLTPTGAVNFSISSIKA